MARTDKAASAGTHERGGTATPGPPRKTPAQAAREQRPNHPRWGRVLKALWPPSPGTLRLNALHAPALLCVRYRQDRAGLRRFTTVELVVETRWTEAAQRKGLQRWWFALAVGRGERDLQHQLRMHGAKWDRQEQRWFATGTTIRRLELEDRICLPPSSENQPANHR